MPNNIFKRDIHLQSWKCCLLTVKRNWNKKKHERLFLRKRSAKDISFVLITQGCLLVNSQCFVHARVLAGVPEICSKTSVRHALYNDSYNYYFYSFSITVISLLALENGFTMTPKRPSLLSITSACLSFNTFSPIFTHWNQTRKHRIGLTIQRDWISSSPVPWEFPKNILDFWVFHKLWKNCLADFFVTL